MIPTEKSEDLINKFKTYSNSYWIGPIVNKGPRYSEKEKIINAKKSALIAADIKIKESEYIESFNDFEYYKDDAYWSNFWKAVKEELETNY